LDSISASSNTWPEWQDTPKEAKKPLTCSPEDYQNISYMMSSSLPHQSPLWSSRREPPNWHKAEKSLTPYSNLVKLIKAPSGWSTSCNEHSSATKETDSGKDSPPHNNLLNTIPLMPQEASTTSQYPWTSGDPEHQTEETGDSNITKDGDPMDKTLTLDETDCSRHIKEGLLKLMESLKDNSNQTCSLKTVSAVATRATLPETAPQTLDKTIGRGLTSLTLTLKKKPISKNTCYQTHLLNKTK
jgi:hypothetical protein